MDCFSCLSESDPSRLSLPLCSSCKSDKSPAIVCEGVRYAPLETEKFVIENQLDALKQKERLSAFKWPEAEYSRDMREHISKLFMTAHFSYLVCHECRKMHSGLCMDCVGEKMAAAYKAYWDTQPMEDKPE